MSFPISITFDIKSPPTAAFDALASSAQKLDQSMQASASNFDKFGQSVSQLESPLSSVGGSMGQLEGSMSGLEGSLGSAAGGMGEFAGSTEQLNGALSETGGFVTDASTGMSDLSGTTSETGGAMGELSGTTGEFNGVIGETGGFVTETGTAMGELSTSTGETGTAMGELNTTTGETNTTFGELNPLVTETQTGFAEMVPVVTETGTGMTELTTATDETNTALETSVDALGNVVPGLQDTATGAADSAMGFSDLKPAVDDTNTALDSSSGLLAGVSPLLADTGTNAGTAATETGEFSGALGGLGRELGPVNGGLTTENTLLGDVGGTSETTAGQTEGLKSSMTGLAFGITGVIGSAFSMVGAFSNLRNAQFRVDAANRIVELSTGKLDKVIAAMNKTITKLATDSEAPIGGLQRLANAQKVFNDLVASGVRTGPQFKAALDELKAAHEGLTTSTAKDAEAAQKLGFQLTTISTGSQKVAIDMNKQTRASEGVAQAFQQIASLATVVVGALGSFAQTMTSGAATVGILKGAFIDLGIVMSQSVIPALGAIAVPVGIAVAAIGAFIAVVTAIRANLRVFDELGMKVGEVFPEMKTFLDDARQAFINLSDGLNSAISVALGAIDQMTGSVANLQAQWTGFTDTLPKGTGELGLAGKAMGQLGHMVSATGEQINIGAGKWENMNGTLVAFGGAVRVAAGGWHELADGTAVYSKSANEGTTATDALASSTEGATTAMDAFGATGQSAGFVLKDLSVNYSELTNAQKLSAAASNAMIESLSNEAAERHNAFLEADKYLRIIEGINPAVGLSKAAITGMAQGLREEAGAHADAVTAAAAYIATKDLQFLMVKQTDEAILAHAEKLKEEEKATDSATEAIAKHVEELQKLHTTLQENAAELAFYAEAGNLAGRMQLEFSIGVQEASLKLIDQQAALARSTGELQGNLVLLEEGKLQEVAYGQGVIEAANALVTKTQALEKAKGAYDATNLLMKDGRLQAIEFAAGMQETATAIQKNALELVKLAGELEAYSRGTTMAEANNQAMVRGFLEQKKALIDVSQEYANAAGAVEALRMELTSSEAAVLRFNKGVMEGRKSALEFMIGMEEARGEAIGFRTELLSAATAITKGMGDMSRKSTEALQQIIEVASGVPGAFQKVVQGIDAMGQKIVDTLTDAAQESREKFNDEIEAMEKDLGTKFSQPIVQELHLQARVEDATRDIETAMGVFAAMLRDKPLEVALETQGAQDALKLLQAEVDKAAALSPKFQPLQTALNNLAAWTPSQGLDQLPVLLTKVLQGAQEMEGGMQGVITAFDSMFSAAAQSQEGLAALQTAFTGMGLSFDTTTGIIKDGTGKVMADLQVMGESATNSAATTVTALDTLGPAGTAARTTLAFELVALEFLMDRMAQEVKQSAIEVSTAFANMATNTGTSLNTLASGIIIMLAAFAKIGSGSQSMATTVSGSFSNMASNTRASMNTMASGIMIIIASFTRMGSDAQRGTTTVSTAFTSMGSRVTSATNTARSSITTFTSAVTTMASTGSSRASSFASSFASSMSRVGSSASSAAGQVRSLQSAINSLKSKTIVITTVLRTVRQFVASGGAFIASSPTHVGPLNVSEFGQAELVTVTPLQNPSGQTITGPGMQVSTSGPGAKAFAKSGNESISLGGPMTDAEADKKAREFIDKIFKSIEAKTPKGKQGKTILIKETPIVIKMDARTIVEMVNKRIFEISDSILA